MSTEAVSKRELAIREAKAMAQAAMQERARRAQREAPQSAFLATLKDDNERKRRASALFVDIIC